MGGRGGMTELQVSREVDIGEGSYYVAEDKEGEKGQQYHGQEMVGEYVSDHLYGPKIAQHPDRKDEHKAPERDTHQSHDQSPFFEPSIAPC